MKIIPYEAPVYGKICLFNIDGEEVKRRVYYNIYDGLYIMYKGKKYFESEFTYLYPNTKED